MKKFHVLAAAVVVALGSTFAVAQTVPGAGHARPDANGDGVIDRAEAAKLPRLSEKFDQLDKNKDGKLSADERPQHRRGMQGGRKGGERGAQLKALDTDQDGRISRSEAQSAKGPMAARFDQMDANHDGYLDRADRQARMAERRAAFFADADANKDGRLTRDEFAVEQGARSAEHREKMAQRAQAAGKQLPSRPMPSADQQVARAGKAFERIDANQDGVVSKAEFDAFKPAHQGRGMQPSRG